MIYQVLTEAEQHDMLLGTLYAQERDHWLHSVNKERFQAILADPTITKTFRSQVQILLEQTDARLHEVTQIIEKLRPQLPQAEQLHAALLRIRNGNQA
jgi:hypothetical protein